MARVVARHPTWERFAPPVYLALLALAELLTAYAPPAIGLTIHAGLLLGLLAHVGLSADPALRALLLTLCMAPLIRLLSLSLPLARLPQIAWYLVVSIPLFLACGLLIRTLGYSRVDLSLRLGRPGLQLVIMLLGLGLGVVEFLILRPTPLVAALTWQQLVLPSLILLICTGFSEELIFRGVMQRAAYTALGRWAIVYVAAVFAVLHMGYRSFGDVLFVFAVGVLFGWLVARSGSLLGVTLAHGLTNIMLFLILPFVGLPAPRPLSWAVPPWATELALIGLWVALLAALGLVIRDRLARRRQAALPNAAHTWARQLGPLVTAPALDAPALERLARAVWQQLAPDYVLIIDGDRTRAESVISLAIGATGRRLHSLEGLSTPWETFAHMVAGDLTVGLRETRTHPFSRHPGNYLILPLAASHHWLLVRAASGREQPARTILAAL